MECQYCGKEAVYRCSVCGKSLCTEHAKLRTVCSSCTQKTALKCFIQKMSQDNEKEKIQEFVQRFWGEEEQLTFDRKFTVSELPAYIARLEKGKDTSSSSVIGFVSFTEAEDSILIVALGVLPQYQNSGVGRRLIKKVEDEAKSIRKRRLLVSTSNDDLPVLAFYQSLGFQIYDVKPNVIAEKHHKVLKGIGGLPVRDELRLQKILLQVDG